MMKKTRLFPKIAAMMIVAIMVCVMVASAYQATPPLSMEMTITITPMALTMWTAQPESVLARG